MAAPGVSTYSTGGPVRTGRTAYSGDYFTATLRAKAVDGELAAGSIVYTGVRTFQLIPVVTWVDYPTGIVDIPLSGGNPTAGAPAPIYQSYNSPWYSWTNFFPYPIREHPTHQIELRYMCTLYLSATRRIVWMSPGGGSDYYLSPTPPPGPQFESWRPAKNCDFSANITMDVSVDLVERVDITQATAAGGAWVWPADCLEDGMGKTSATFDCRATGVSSKIKIGDDEIEMPESYIPTYPFTASRTIDSQVGLFTGAITTFGWGIFSEVAYKMTGGKIFDDLTPVAKMICGVTEADLRLGRDSNGDAITYTGTAANGRSSGVGENNEIRYLATHAPSFVGGYSYTKATWTNLGLSYKHNVDFAAMDGSSAGITPEFKCNRSGTVWSGTTSPLIVYSGTWTLQMRDLAGSIMSTYSPATDHVSGAGASWSRSEPAPTALSLQLTNPEDYNDTVNGDLDDRRVQFVYPRERSVVSWALADSVILDGLSNTGADGVGGWTAVDCTLTVVSGKLVVTNASPGAYIYRADFMIDSDIRKPKHWPGHRFARIIADETTTALVLVVKRTGGADTTAKNFSPVDISSSSGITTLTFDTCRPASGHAVDQAESYINAALPLDTVWESGERQNNELSALSWSWGIGTFDRVEISGFEAGKTYTLHELSAVYVSPTVSGLERTYYGKTTYVQPECNARRPVGDTVVNDDEMDNWRNYVWRHAIGVVNGRYAWEAPSVKVSMSPNFEVDLYSNYSVKSVFEDVNNRWPLDDFAAYTFTLTAAYDASWWDETLEEYTTEDVLFCKDTLPAWFLLNKRQAGEHDNLHDNSIFAAPRYDNLTVYPNYGDGINTGERAGYATLNSIKRVRGRVNGIAYHAGNLPYFEAEPDSLEAYYSVREDSASGTEYKSDGFGYYRTGDIRNPQPLWIGDGFSLITLHPKSRVWMRLVFDLVTGATCLAITSSRQTGRIYLVYALATDLKMRVFDFGRADYKDKLIDALPAGACGIAYIGGKQAGLSMVLDDADGKIYRKTSTNEGESWGAAMSIATGTLPQVCYCDKSRSELISYYQNGNIYVKIKKDEGQFGDAVMVASADEAPAALTVCPGTRDYKIVCAMLKSGEIRRYTSVDNGLTWTLDE